MSSLPAEVDFFADRSATEERMNRAMAFLVAWLRRVESVQPEFLAVTAELKTVGLQRLDAVLSPIFVDAADIAAQLAAIRTAWLTAQPLTQLLTDLSAQVTARLASVDGKLSDVDARLVANLAAVTTQLGNNAAAVAAQLAANTTGVGDQLAAQSASVDAKLAAFSPTAKWAAATTAEGRSATASRLISAAVLWAMEEPVVLADATTIALDFATGIHFTVTLGANRTLATPTNGKPGQEGFIRVVQDATGGRALSFAAAYKFLDLATAPSLNPAAAAVTLLRYQVTATGEVFLSGGRPVSALREQTIRGHFHSNGSDYIYGTYYARVQETVTYTMISGQSGYLTTSANGGQVLINGGSVGSTGSIVLPAGSNLNCVSTTPGQSAAFHINRTL
jgi:hypothetical protein